MLPPRWLQIQLLQFVAGLINLIWFNTQLYPAGIDVVGIALKSARRKNWR